MSAMVSMLSGMLGITPEELKKLADDFSGGLSDLNRKLDDIRRDQREILARLKGEHYDGRDYDSDATGDTDTGSATLAA